MNKPVRGTTRRGTAPGRATSRTAKPARATGRATAARPGAPGKNNNALVIGAVVGVIAVGALGFLMMRGEEKEPVKKPAAEAPKEKPLDVRELVAAGMRSCEEGYDIIQSCRPQMEKQQLSDAERVSLKAKLQDGTKKISAGMGMISEATEKSGSPQGAPRPEWGSAKKFANNFLQNLGQ